MNRSSIALGVIIGCAVLAGSVSAASVVNPEQQRRSDLVLQIVEKWGDHVEERYGTSLQDWAREMTPAFARASDDALSAAASATTFDAMGQRLLGWLYLIRGAAIAAFFWALG